MAEAQVQDRALSPIVQVREELIPMRAEFGAVLPSHITAEKFTQVCITALENNPDLLSADRQSFKVACLNAANDGLLPDKREGAFVMFNTEVSVRVPNTNATRKEWHKLVQWMPMITGVLKKAYQTGKVESISVELVHENDVYRRAAGDNAAIVHEPLDFGDRGKVRGGYAIIRMVGGGEPYREVMSISDIEKVRSVSKAKDRGPWVTFWEEMAKKTLLRRALKRVPLSAEVDRVLARDDVFYDLNAERRPLLEAPARRAIPNDALFSKRALPAPEEDADQRGDVEAAVEEVEPLSSDAPESDPEPAKPLRERVNAALKRISEATDIDGLAKVERMSGPLRDDLDRQSPDDLLPDFDAALRKRRAELEPPPAPALGNERS